MNISEFDHIFISQDGFPVSDIIKSKFDLKPGIDTKYINKNIELEIFDTVGLIVKKNNVLIIFPKHYYPDEKLKKSSHEYSGIQIDIENLFDVISKYVFNKELISDKFYGELYNFSSDYPFREFFQIYNYYINYGLFKDKIVNIKEKGQKINWKVTINKSKSFVSSNNIILFPLYFNNAEHQENFITECMSFVIDYSIKLFSFLFKINYIGLKYDFDFLNNKDFVIRTLQKFYNTTQKDIHKFLLQSLITFFIKLENNSDSGDINIKIKFFNQIWEDMVEKYLNNNFIGIDNNKELVFLKNSNNYKFKKQSFSVDSTKNNFKIQPDYYILDSNSQFIFDAKYYNDINSLNYKQFTYHAILKNTVLPGGTVSSLIMPTEKNNYTEEHFSLKSEYLQTFHDKVDIIIQFLNTKEVMLNYTN